MILPLIKILPPVYRWRIRSKVYKWYEQLQSVEDHTHVDTLAQAEYEHLNSELDRIYNEVSKLNTPLSNADQVYNLLVHVDLIKKSLKAKFNDEKR
ncbi:hypothetical protein [sulfur-oxidizing endosymbiont of Gigantopelta aegis]|uniref:hypothetical protein n=1 Tax=sulfur-oxidizing endosymbiont of Gigantopelta aegis TaxID=2794934 RepID=UPI001BE4DFD3|nr:hypothetical protein [sulfur-oxidizing endosymbiont of Gigantopelta aegis]